MRLNLWFILAILLNVCVYDGYGVFAYVLQGMVYIFVNELDLVRVRVNGYF